MFVPAAVPSTPLHAASWISLVWIGLSSGELCAQSDLWNWSSAGHGEDKQGQENIPHPVLIVK